MSATGDSDEHQISEQEDQDPSHEITELLATLPVRKGWVHPFHYQYKGVWLSQDFLLEVLSLEKCFISRDTDFCLATSIKVGTTWLKALAFAITTRHQYSLSNHPLRKSNPHELVNGLEYFTIQWYGGSSDLSNLPNPRLLATHLPYTLLPESVKDSGCRICYLCRNPKDTFVSMYKFFNKLMPEEMGGLPLEEAFEMFCNGESLFGPYWDHVMGYWNISKEKPNKILFLSYEELKKDQASNVKRLAQFMGIPFSAEEEEEGMVEQIVKLCSFESLSNLEVNKNGELQVIDKKNGSLKRNVANSLFFREGKVGDSANHLTPEMLERVDNITKEKLKGSGLTLDE